MLKTGQLILTGGTDLRPALPKRADAQHVEIVAALRSARPYLAFDNVREVDGDALTLLATADCYSGRTLGISETRFYQNRLMLAFTGINPTFSKEMQRRVLGCRIVTGVEKPELRDSSLFKYPRLEMHVTNNRAALCRALLVIAQSWLARGRPVAPDVPVLASYEAWCAVVPHILEAAGIRGCLTNRDLVSAEVAGVSDSEDAVPDFVAEWHKAATAQERTSGNAPIRLDGMLARDLLTFAADRSLDLGLKTRFGEGDYDYSNQSFGQWLNRVKGRPQKIGDDNELWEIVRETPEGERAGRAGNTWGLRRRGAPQAV